MAGYWDTTRNVWVETSPTPVIPTKPVVPTTPSVPATPVVSTATSSAGNGAGGSSAPESGMEVAGGYQWFAMAQQNAQFNYEMAYRYYTEHGVNERFAQQLADNEKNRSLQRSIATGYIDGNPTLDRQVAEWAASGYIGGQPTLAREQMESQNALSYLSLLSQQRGPRDWLVYQNTLRNAQGTKLPAYAQALATGQKISPYQSTAGTTSGANSFQNQTIMPGTQGYTSGQQPAWTQQPVAQPTGMSYEAAIQQARQQLAALGGAQWLNASADQIVAELRGNPTLFTGNNPIRTALLGGQQAGPIDTIYPSGGQYQISPMEQMPDWLRAQQANAPARTDANTGTLPAEWQQALQQMGVPAWTQNTAQQPGGGDYTSFNQNAIKVRPDQWNNMTNSEQQMLFGQVENAGGDPTDWEQMMRRAWSQGTAKGQSIYGY